MLTLLLEGELFLPPIGPDPEYDSECELALRSDVGTVPECDR